MSYLDFRLDPCPLHNSNHPAHFGGERLTRWWFLGGQDAAELGIEGTAPWVVVLWELGA